MTSSLSPAMISSLLAGPAVTPPPGVVSNFQDPVNRQVEGRALMLVGLIIMLLPLMMRLYTQWFFTKAYVFEDLIIIIGVAFSVALFATEYIILSPGHTSGYHMWDVTLGEFYQSQQLVNYIEIMYNIALIFVKVAILVQIRRVFALTRRTNPILWSSCWAWIFMIPIFYTIVTFFNIFQCWPRQKIWNPFIPGHCVSFLTANFLATAIFNLVSDISILILPLPAIYKLHMKLKKKILVGGLFATGALASVASAIRLYFSFVLINNADTSWNYLPDGVTAFFECVIGVVVFSLPVAPKFVWHVQDKMFTLRHGQPRSQGPSADQLRHEQDSRPGESSRASPPREFGSSLGVSSIRQYLGRKFYGTDDNMSTVIIPKDKARSDSMLSGESLGMVTIRSNKDRV